MQVKYPELKKIYDGADVQSNFMPDPEEEKKFFTEKEDYDLRVKQAELKMKKLQNYEIFDSDDEKEEENNEKKLKEIERLKAISAAIDKATEELGKAYEKNKVEIEKYQKELMDKFKSMPKVKEKEEYVNREKDENLEKLFEENQKKWEEMIIKNLKEGEKIEHINPFQVDSKDDGKEGLRDSGTYVLKDGKLIKGEGEKREEVMFSNWY